MLQSNKVKAIVLMVMMAALSLAIVGCGMTGKNESKDRLAVVTTVYPAYDLVKQIGGDKVDVSMLVPMGAEPHDWEPTASDLKKIGEAKVFVYNGAGLEPSEKLLEPSILKKAMPVELASAVDVMKRDVPDEHEDEHEHGHNHNHESGIDPHIWLAPENVIREVDLVVDALSKADLDNKAYYESNGKAYKAELEKLHAEYKELAASLPDKNLVVSHEAFGYLAKAYGFKQLGIMGIAPDSEPTPEHMAYIVKFIKENSVKAIFSEELINPKLAEAIAQETHVKVYVLNTIEGLNEDQQKANATYMSLMKENLKTLKEALGK